MPGDRKACARGSTMPMLPEPSRGSRRPPCAPADSSPPCRCCRARLGRPGSPSARVRRPGPTVQALVRSSASIRASASTRTAISSTVRKLIALPPELVRVATRSDKDHGRAPPALSVRCAHRGLGTLACVPSPGCFYERQRSLSFAGTMRSKVMTRGRKPINLQARRSARREGPTWRR